MAKIPSWAEEKIKEGYNKLKEKYPDLTYDEYVRSVVGKKDGEKELEDRLNQGQLDENVDRLTDPVKIAEDYNEIKENIDPLIEADKEKEKEAGSNL